MQYKIYSFQNATNLASATIDFFSLASTPNCENCTQAGQQEHLQILECTAYINQLIRIHGPTPAGAVFFIIRNQHDFGYYYEAGIFFQIQPANEEKDQEAPKSLLYAQKCEQGPEYWDQSAKNELREKGHDLFQPAKIIPIRRTA